MQTKCVFFDFDEVFRTWEHEFYDLFQETGIPLDSFAVGEPRSSYSKIMFP